MAIAATRTSSRSGRQPRPLGFRAAALGLWQAYREEPNLRFHLFAATAAALAGWAVHLEGWEVAYLAITIFLVLTAETVNTAVERAVDFAARGERHPLAGAAKDIAAGAVLLTALHALWAGVWLFAVERPLAVTLQALFSLLLTRPWSAALPLLAGAMGISLGRRR